MIDKLFEYEKNSKNFKKSGMRICYGKGYGGHQLIAHGEGICPLCLEVQRRNALAQELKALNFMRDELFDKNITLDEYITKTKEYKDGWRSVLS